MHLVALGELQRSPQASYSWIEGRIGEDRGMGNGRWGRGEGRGREGKGRRKGEDPQCLKCVFAHDSTVLLSSGISQDEW